MHESKTLKPLARVVVVSADAAWREDVVAGINAAAQTLDNPFALEAVQAVDGPQAIATVLGDGDVHIVVIDHGPPPARAGA
ncbi:MAG TPA: ornithine decarboxylase, partial [Burkholderiaceae bacterium]|nr:ornithine decarboxylase [Burkholderiaceae bacterium]